MILLLINFTFQPDDFIDSEDTDEEEEIYNEEKYKKTLNISTNKLEEESDFDEDDYAEMKKNSEKKNMLKKEASPKSSKIKSRYCGFCAVKACLLLVLLGFYFKIFNYNYLLLLFFHYCLLMKLEV